jgi:hypothetical protein
VECKVCHHVLLNTKTRVGFDRLLQINILDETEEDKDMSWKFCKVVECSKEKQMLTAQIMSVWWNGMMLITLNHG